MEEFGKTLLGGGMAAASALNPAMAIAGAAQPLFQGILGLTQGARARQIARRYPRPTYQIPGAATNALNDQRNLAMGQAPGLNTARQQLMQIQAGSANAIMGSGGGNNETLAALAMLDQNAGNQALDLGAMQEQFKAQQMGNLINEENAYAQWQEKKQDWDVTQPYIQAMEKSAAMNDAANTNVHDALGVAGGLVAQTLKSGEPKALMAGAAAKTGLMGAGLSLGAGLGKLANPAKVQSMNTTPPELATSDATKLPTRQLDGPAVRLRSNSQRLGFNPNLGANESYDFGALTGKEAGLKSFDPNAGANDAVDLSLRNSVGTPLAAVNSKTPSLMPSLGARGTRKSSKYRPESPEFDLLGNVRRAK